MFQKIKNTGIELTQKFDEIPAESNKPKIISLAWIELNLSAVTSMITIKEKYVRNPSPLPPLPKICCSIGADVIVNTKSICATIKIEIIYKILISIFLNSVFLTSATCGIKYAAKQNNTITFGTTNESKFTQGVKIKVTITPK